MRISEACRLVLHAVVCAGLLLPLFSQGAAAQAAKPTVSGDRVAEIEQRLIDLQVQIATIRSLNGPAKSQRIAQFEGEMASLAREFRKLSGKASSIRPGLTTALAPGPASQLPSTPGTSGQGGASGWVGRTTVTRPGTQSSLPVGQGELIRRDVFPQQGQRSNSVARWAKPDAPTASSGAGAASSADDQEYQTAYRYLLQQDYGAAQTAFAAYLERYPDRRLAGNAQYWLGETHYVRGAYRAAAVAFLKGYEKYGNGNKGADSLLKLGLSLAKLKQTDAACSSLRELGGRYRAAPRALLERANAEMRRLRCQS